MWVGVGGWVYVGGTSIIMYPMYVDSFTSPFRFQALALLH